MKARFFNNFFLPLQLSHPLLRPFYPVIASLSPLVIASEAWQSHLSHHRDCHVANAPRNDAREKPGLPRPSMPRNDKQECHSKPFSSCHSEPFSPCHSEPFSLCHSESFSPCHSESFSPCHSEPFSLCHSERSEESGAKRPKNPLQDKPRAPLPPPRLTIKHPKLDNTDKNLLNVIQAEFPLSREPFAALGERLSISSDEVIHRIERLKEEGIIRLIGPVFNPRRLGYQTTLAAMKVATEQLGEAGKIISAHPLVSHCYERDHDFNLWFTLAVPSTDDIENKVHELGNKIKAETTLNLPAVRTFKIGAYFNLGERNASMPATVAPHNRLSNTNSELSPTDRAVITELQQDLPLIEKPFDLMASKLSLDVDKFLSRCHALLQRGIMRRFSAAINHNKLGFTANAMACWKTPPGMVEAAGRKIAAFPEISHCYERQTSSLWPYNLFAMIHANTRETCKAIAANISSEIGLNENEPVLLFSTKEIKKSRVRYTV